MRRTVISFGPVGRRCLGVRVIFEGSKSGGKYFVRTFRSDMAAVVEGDYTGEVRFQAIRKPELLRAALYWEKLKRRADAESFYGGLSNGERCEVLCKKKMEGCGCLQDLSERPPQTRPRRLLLTTRAHSASAIICAINLETEMSTLDILAFSRSFAPSMSLITAQDGQVFTELEARRPEQMPTRCRNIHR